MKSGDDLTSLLDRKQRTGSDSGEWQPEGVDLASGGDASERVDLASSIKSRFRIKSTACGLFHRDHASTYTIPIRFF